MTAPSLTDTLKKFETLKLKAGVAAVMAGGLVVFTTASCTSSSPKSDPNPPSLSINWRPPGPDGSPGPNTTVAPDGQITTQATWISGPNNGANPQTLHMTAIAQQGASAGMSQFVVSGTGYARCATHENSQGQTFINSYPVGFPTQTENSNPGTVKSNFFFILDPFIGQGISCGTHVSGLNPPQEYFLESGNWTITTTAANCCNVRSSAKFTITLT